jgi:UDP-2,3-diacylglucosamine hydrolase
VPALLVVCLSLSIKLKLYLYFLIYFASDLHLGSPNHAESLVREQLFVQWLQKEVAPNATELYIVGDLFDFWFEYKTVVPRGYVRVLGALAQLRDAGLPIFFFSGNHDLWMFGYFEKELNIPVSSQPVIKTIGNHNFYIAHGDGLGPGDTGYKWIKKWLFTNRFCQWLMRVSHPDIAIGLANFFSTKSRQHNQKKIEQLLSAESNRLINYAQTTLQTNPHIHFFVFGHQHHPQTTVLSPTCQYINLGDWITHFTYAVYNGQNLQLYTYKP